MTPLVRAAVLEDSETILELMVSVIRASLEAEYWSDITQNVTQNLAIWTKQPNRCVHLVAECESRIVGVILVKEFWNLCSLFVVPDHQGKGIGRLLVEQAIAACRVLSSQQAIVLNAAPNAIKFYLALGFQVRSTSQHLPPGFQAMTYELFASEA